MAWCWGGGRDVCMHRQVVRHDSIVGASGKKSFARPQVVDTDASDDPVHSGSLGVHGVVVQTEPPVARPSSRRCSRFSVEAPILLCGA